jgi:hypothetical protein
MADGTKTSGGHTIARHVAPFAPLALAVLMSRAVLPGGRANLKEMDSPNDVEAATCDEVLDFQDCHSRYPTGCSKSAGYDPYLNLLKNQLIDPSSISGVVHFLNEKDFADRDEKMPKELSKSNHADFKEDLANLGEGQTFGVIGYLYYAKKTGAESSNCQLESQDSEGSNVDYHIGVGFDAIIGDTLRSKKPLKNKKVLTQESVIVEMTPHYRFVFEDEKWTLDNLKSVIGRQVRVIGQLIVDSEHNLPGQNCALAKTAKQKQSCWRSSVWELHPVTQFQVCKLSEPCKQNSPDWLELEDAARQ